MTVSRRYLAFSLRTLFILLTALSVWLGVVVNRAREQREAVKAIKAFGGFVIYDCDTRLLALLSGRELYSVSPPVKRRESPLWLRRRLGQDFFQDVDIVELLRHPGNPSLHVSDSDMIKAIPQLRRIHSLKEVRIRRDASNETYEQLKRALYACDVVRF